MIRASAFVAVSLALSWMPTAPRSEDSVSFRRDIAPILLENCLACHGAKKAEGGYRLDAFAHLMQAGDSKLTAVSADKPDESELFRRITTDDADQRMPAEGDPLPEAQIELVRQWIEQGAKFDANDESAPLAAIVPPPVHPDPPQTYPSTLPITALAFGEGEEGRELFVGGYHEITVWNLADGALLRRIKNQGQRTYALAFRPADGKADAGSSLLAAASGTPGQLGELRLFRPKTGELIGVPASSADVLLDAAFRPDGRRIAFGGADNLVRVIDVDVGKQLFTINSHSDWVHAVAWSPDGKQLAAASRDKTAKVFDAERGELIISYAGHDRPVHGVAFHPDGQQVYSAAADGRIHLWKISDGKKTADVANFGEVVFNLTTRGDKFVAGSANRSAKLFSLPDKKQIREFAPHADSVLTVAISPEGAYVATGTFAGRVSVFDVQDGKRVASFIAAPGYHEE